MGDFNLIDALTGDAIGFNYETGEAELVKGAGESRAKNIFFPGCSMINYAMPLVEAVYNTLYDAEIIDGISVLCCGKILMYEPDGQVIRDSFEEELRQHVFEAGIEKIICACPNCVKALREAFSIDKRTKGVEIAVLPQVLADMGYKVSKETTAQLLKGSAESDVLLCTHDSCPDREYGDFAYALRAILPDGLWAEPEHCRNRSICCGSLPRAAGKEEQANKCANTNGEEALAVNADAIVTACMSCTFQLNMAQSHLPAVHFLELLYSWKINWAFANQWMKFRFLFNETLGAIEKEGSGRIFEGLGESAADQEVTLSNTDVVEIGE